MIIEININEMGKIITYQIKDKSSKYIKFEKVLPIIKKELKNIKKTNIINKTISIITNDSHIIIKNYMNNKNNDLKIIIDKIFKQKDKERKEYLKNKKIKRIKVISGVLIVTVGIATTTALGKTKDLKIEKNQINGQEQTLSTNETEIKENTLIIEPKEICLYDIEYLDRTTDEKYINTKNRYFYNIEKASREYGIDPKIMLAIATQESGYHNLSDNNPAIGLMQIEKSVWLGESITAFNCNKNEYETIQITEEKLKDIDFNIKVSCMYFQYCYTNCNNNLPLAIQMYNYGYGNINKILNSYNRNLKNINMNDLEWMEYRNIIQKGDPNYLESVLSYIEEPNYLNICIGENNINYSINKKSVKNLTKK